MALTDAEQLVLDFAERRYRYPGARDSAIIEELGISPTRYFQQLNALIDRPDALEAKPVLVKRLRRLRDQRRPTITRRV